MKPKSILFCLLFAACASISFTAKAQAVNVKDSLALVDLYNSTDGPGWHNQENWLTGPVRTWYGITVTGTRVTEINLGYYNNLNGSIPSSLGNLVNLNFLDLSFNSLSGTIPASIGDLVSLDSLILGFNQLSGSIPSSFSNLVNLTYLDLSWSQLSGSIPSSLGNLVNLTYLALSGSQLSGSIPSSIGNLEHLSELNLSYNQLSGNIPSSLGNLVYLQYLDLSFNQLSGSIPSSLGNLVKLQYLYMYNNQLRGSIPSSIGNLVNLMYLALADNQLSGSIPSSLGTLANLNDLRLNNNQLGGAIPSALGNLVNLHYLVLYDNQLSGSIPASLGNLLKLAALDLSYNRFTFNGMELIAKTFPYVTYYPQARIPVHQNGNILSVSAGGTLSNNTYRWCKIGKTGLIHIKTIKGDSVFHPSQSGEYVVAVRNSVAIQLTLYSRKFTYTAPALSNNSPIASSENRVLQNDNTNTFFVYPNPAKDILHVQTNGEATLTITDQSGKVLLTKTINSKGEIYIANLAAGLYYLKNNATGAVEKVIVTR